MAGYAGRGQSPYQGRYTVPIHDYSRMGGGAWGEAFKGVGESIGGAIKKYKLDKEEGLKMAGTIDGMLADYPELEDTIEKNPEMSKILESMGEGKAKLSEVRQLGGFISGHTSAQTRRMRDELLGYHRDEAKDKRDHVETKRGELAEVLKSVESWTSRDVPLATVINDLTPSQKAVLDDAENIKRGDPTIETSYEARLRDYETEVLEGKVQILNRIQNLERQNLERREAVLGAVSPEAAGELATAEHAAKRAQVEAAPGRISHATRMNDLNFQLATGNLSNQKWSSSEAMRDQDTRSRNLLIDYRKAMLDGIKATNLAKAYAAMNPSDAKQLGTVNDSIKDLMATPITWKSDKGKFTGDYNEFLDAQRADDSVVSSSGDAITGRLQNRFNTQQRLLESGRVMVDVSRSPAEQAAQLPSRETFEDYNVYVERLLDSGISPEQIPPPTEDEERTEGADPELRFRRQREQRALEAAKEPSPAAPSAGGGGAFDPATRQRMIDAARAQGLDDETIRAILGE